MVTPETPPSPSPSSTRPFSQASSQLPKITKLHPTDLTALRFSLGVPFSPESQTLTHAPSTLWPSHGLPPGLYRSIILSRTISQYQYLLFSLLFNISLVLQILLGAAVTALGSSDTHGLAVTVLAAANTVNAGLLALMHNSGLPERYKNDWNEFEEVELWVRKVVETGVVELVDELREEWGVKEVVHECFEKYAAAKRTIQKNKPAAYMPTVAKGVSASGKSREG